jgi:hypothetical protein
LVVGRSRSDGLEAGIYKGEAAARRFGNTLLELFERVARNANGAPAGTPSSLPD